MIYISIIKMKKKLRISYAALRSWKEKEKRFLKGLLAN